MTVGVGLTYDGDSATTEEDGSLTVRREGKIVGQVKPDAWISWEVYEDDDYIELPPNVGSDLDVSGGEHISPL